MKKAIKIDRNWTLFLDRDGVINKKVINGYVTKWSEFSLANGSLQALTILSSIFSRIIVVTNQRGIGKGLMTENDLNVIHANMLDLVFSNGGRIDKIYYSSEISDTSFSRKPNTGMAMIAKRDFPDIDFEKSIMVGDSLSDMEFGRKLKMITMYIGFETNSFSELVDFSYSTLFEASLALSKCN